MYIFALDTPLSKDQLSKDYKKMGFSYGRSMLKTALLLGWSPIISENQIVDSNLVLSEVASESEFRNLINSGHIRLSVFSTVPTYREALAGFLNRADWISSAWNHSDKNELKQLLEIGGAMPSSQQKNDGLLQYNGLTVLDDFRSKNVSLVPAQRAKTLLVDYISHISQSIVKHTPENMRQVALNANKLLEDVHSTLSEKSQNNRTAWLTLLQSKEFQENHSSILGEGAWDTAYFIVMLAYNEVLCESVANGIGLRSIAFMSVPTEKIHPYAESLIALIPQIEKTNAEIDSDLMGIPVNTMIPSTSQKNLKAIDDLSWATIRKIVNSPQFSQYSSTARTNVESRKRFMDWLSDQAGMGFAEEYDAANKPIIRIGSKILANALGGALGGAVAGPLGAVSGAVSLVALDVVLNLIGTSTLSELLSKQIGKLQEKEFALRINASTKKAFDKVVAK